MIAAIFQNITERHRLVPVTVNIRNAAMTSEDFNTLHSKIQRYRINNLQLCAIEVPAGVNPDDLFSHVIYKLRNAVVNYMILMDNGLTDVFAEKVANEMVLPCLMLEMDLSGNSMTDTGFMAISEKIPYSSLRILDWSRNQIGATGLNTLATALTNKECSFHTLILKECDLSTDDKLQALCKVLPFLSRIDLTNATVPENKRPFFEALRGCTKLRTLQLAGIPLYVYQWDELLNCLAHTEVDSLAVEAVSLTPLMINNLANVPKLRNLELNRTRFIINICGALARLLANNQYDSIKFVRCRLDENTIDVLANEGIRSSTALKRFEIEQNLIPLNHFALWSLYSGVARHVSLRELTINLTRQRAEPVALMNRGVLNAYMNMLRRPETRTIVMLMALKTMPGMGILSDAYLLPSDIYRKLHYFLQ